MIARDWTGPGDLVYEVLQGSHAYGTQTETSDQDWRGVYLLNNDAFLGLDRPQLTHEVRANDEVHWELGNFFRLLLKGNPNIVGMLWSPADCLVTKDVDVMEGLIRNRQKMIHTKTVNAYLQWAFKELREIDRFNAKTSGVRDYSKRLSHVPRLLWEIEGAVTQREIPVRLEGEHLVTVRAIKSGDMGYDEAVEFCGQLLLDVEAVVEREMPTIPEPPVEYLTRYLMSVRHDEGARVR